MVKSKLRYQDPKLEIPDIKGAQGVRAKKRETRSKRQETRGEEVENLIRGILGITELEEYGNSYQDFRSNCPLDGSSGL